MLEGICKDFMLKEPRLPLATFDKGVSKAGSKESHSFLSRYYFTHKCWGKSGPKLLNDSSYEILNRKDSPFSQVYLRPYLRLLGLSDN